MCLLYVQTAPAWSSLGHRDYLHEDPALSITFATALGLCFEQCDLPWSEPGQAKKGKVTRGFLMASSFTPEPSYCHGYNFLLPTSDTRAEWLLEWLETKWSEAIWEQFWTLLLWTSIYCFNGQVALQVHSHVCGMLFIIHPQKWVSITVGPSSWFLSWSSPLSELIEPRCLETQWQQLFFICLKESSTFLLASC